MCQSTSGPGLQAVCDSAGVVPIAPPAHSEAHFDCHFLPDLFQDHFSLHEAVMLHWCSGVSHLWRGSHTG